MYKFNRAAKAGIGATLMAATIVFLAIGGWVANIVKLLDMTFAGSEGLFAGRVAGIFFIPLGSILGYF